MQKQYFFYGLATADSRLDPLLDHIVCLCSCAEEQKELELRLLVTIDNLSKYNIDNNIFHFGNEIGH